ncbi:MAG: hypothetical protein QME63_03515, partial [Actinomycetota bacterium]|nr:hypothetical protein [Actinomycetota bacterium]
EIWVETGIEHCLGRRHGLLPPTVGVQSVWNNQGVLIATKTRYTDIKIAEAQLSRVAPGMIKQDYRTFSNECGVSEDFRWQADAGQIIEIEKFVCVYTSRDTDDPIKEAAEGVIKYAKRGFNEL